MLETTTHSESFVFDDAFRKKLLEMLDIFDDGIATCFDEMKE
jgi:uncharacterized UPF0160 family protein